MKFHKTSKRYRSTYSYEFFNDKDYEEVITIYPGKDGVTELDIKTLHYLDDKEVKNNIANNKPPLTEKQKLEIKKWTENYVQVFQAKYGYTPCKTDLDFVIKERFPANWSIAFDANSNLYFDKTSIVLNNTKVSEKDAEEAVRDRIALLLKDLSDRDKEIYRRVLFNGESKITVAKDLGISRSSVYEISSQIKKILISDKFLKNFFHFLENPQKTKP